MNVYVCESYCRGHIILRVPRENVDMQYCIVQLTQEQADSIRKFARDVDRDGFPTFYVRIGSKLEGWWLSDLTDDNRFRLFHNEGVFNTRPMLVEE